jgi:hypothetical protein
LISDKFDETGIATYDATYEGRPTTFVVQLFGRQPSFQKQQPVVPPAPTPAAVVKTPVQKVAVATPEVKGESISIAQAPVDPQEPAPVSIVNEPTFAVVQNTNESDSSGTTVTPSVPRYSTLMQQFLVHQGRYVQDIYFALIIIVYLALIGMVVVEFRTQHVKNIVLGILLLSALAALAYINSSFVLSFI